MAEAGGVGFVPGRVEGLADVTEAAVFTDRIELVSQGRRISFRLADIAAWPRPAFLSRRLARLGRAHVRCTSASAIGPTHRRSGISASTRSRASSCTCRTSQRTRNSAARCSGVSRKCCSRAGSEPGTWGSRRTPIGAAHQAATAMPLSVAP